MADPFSGVTDAPYAPATRARAVTPDDTNPLPDVPKGLYVGSGGTLALRGVNDIADQSWKNVPAGNRFTEAAHGGGGYDYTPISTDYGNAAAAQSAVKLAPGAIGYLGAKTTGATGDGPLIGATTNTAITGINSITYALFANPGGSNPNWQVWLAGAIPTANGASVAVQAGDIVRVERDGANTIALRVARAGAPASFTTVHTIAGGASGALYGAIGAGNPGAGNVIVTPFGSSNVA